MKNIILFGPPGAGKGTQADIIRKKYNFIHISTGDTFRENISNNTDLGKLAKSYIDRGDLVPDELTVNMLKNVLDDRKTDKGYIFDGFPRTELQAKAFDIMLSEKKLKIDKFISLKVDDDILVKRLLNRGKESSRVDDKDENIIRNRIREYYKKTDILNEYYKKQGKYVEIKGEGELERITEHINKIIDNI